MEKRNLFVSGKAVVAAVCGAFTAAFGWLGWLVVAWAACMALDWVSGSAAAASRGAWSSAAARAGIWHKAGMVVVVLVCALTDAVLAVAVANLPGLGRWCWCGTFLPSLVPLPRTPPPWAHPCPGGW